MSVQGGNSPKHQSQEDEEEEGGGTFKIHKQEAARVRSAVTDHGKPRQRQAEREQARETDRQRDRDSSVRF